MWMTNTLQPAVIMYFYTDRYTAATDPAAVAAIKAKDAGAHGRDAQTT